ncbi:MULTISPECIES: Ku protein [Rhodomicrobium]|uniref:non-homologous end joining protein Ku n=1 Tax=Rhodomicrobium TaxID=1068 RepID=UPI000B4AAE93|nr:MULTISPECIES: Ku protein [Rhodomicrobium]
MAPRTFWKGYLKLSLVTCAVAMTPATTSREKVRFHTVNSATGNRLRTRYVDEETGKPVEGGDEAKGYETDAGHYITLEDDEIEAIGLESTRTINIDTFVPANSIDWIWYDTPHYLLPDDDVAQEAFSVIRDAMAATDTVGISRLVLYRRERAVMLEPRGKGIVLWTLRYGDEVRDPKDYIGDAEIEKPDPKSVALVERLIEDLSQPWDRSMVDDPVQKRLKDIIEGRRKKKGKKPAAKAQKDEAEASTNVISIMDALKKSLETEKKGKR